MDIITIKDVKIQLGEMCKQHRKQANISQEELAKLLVLSRFTIQNFESGKNATLDTVLRIAYHFGYLPILHKMITESIQTAKIEPFY
jgi:DNA-binding XRE family transcriptional regulator